MSSERSPGSSVWKSTNASSGSTFRTSIALKGRKRGLSVSLALRGVFGVFGREASFPLRNGVDGTVEIGRGLDVVRVRDSVEIAAVYFLLVARSGVAIVERGRRPTSSAEAEEERGRRGVLGI